MQRAALLRRRYTTPGVFGVAIAVVAALAITSNGFPVRHVDLNDGGIWVTSDHDGVVGRFNKPIAQIDGPVILSNDAAPTLDVLQDGATVFGWDKGAGKLFSFDVRVPKQQGSGVVMPSTAQVGLGGGTLAALTADGKLRMQQVTAGGGDPTALSADAKPAASTIPPNSQLAVGTDGNVYLAETDRLLTLNPATSAKPTVRHFSPTLPAGFQLTVAGSTPVIVSAQTHTVVLPTVGKTAQLPDTSDALAVQQPSATTSYAAIATGSGLYAVDTASAAVTTLSTAARGAPISPVNLDGCTHAVWTGGAYVRSCDRTPAAGATGFSVVASDRLAFRVNRGLVVLNDLTTGQVFLVDDHMKVIKPQYRQTTHDHNQKQTPGTAPQGADKPPSAKPDNLGVRPGRTSVLHVLDNDSDPDSSLLAISAPPTPDNSQVTVSIAPDGQSLLATVPDGVSGQVHFHYTIDDGQKTSPPALVTLTVRAPNQNGQPTATTREGYQKPGPLYVASGGSLSLPVIADWRDLQDSDPLFLDAGSLHVSPASAGTLSTTSDGVLTFTAAQPAGKAALTYGVTDGIGQPRTETLTVTVLSPTSTSGYPAEPQPDVARVAAGARVTLHPLANDIPGADPADPTAKLTLAGPVAPPKGTSVDTDAATGTVTFSATVPGSYLMKYRAAMGSAPIASGQMRVIATAASHTHLPPVAMPDVAVVRGGQPALVDVLSNDTDPQGEVLAVTSAAATSADNSVAVVAGRWLRITSSSLDSSVARTVHYTVSDGEASATGSVSVTNTPEMAKDPGPQPHDDNVVVRAGDVTTVPVLDNDSDPDGEPLSLKPSTYALSPAVPGVSVTADGNQLRIIAAPTARAGQTTVDYVVADSGENSATGTVSITVTPVGKNQPPAPLNVEARTTAGDALTIHIPTYGVDPDGDSVAVTTVSPPSLGRIVHASADQIVYQSYPFEKGTDTFTYTVTDRFRGTGQATIRVGVMSPAALTPPQAVDDDVEVAPGRLVQVNVLHNDVVAPGDKAPVSIGHGPLPGGAHLVDDTIVVRAGQDPKTPEQVPYTISDGTGHPSSATLTVHAVKGAFMPPVAGDDYALPPANGDHQVVVNVLANDFDPDGVGQKVTLLPSPGTTRVGDKLRFELDEFPHDATYRIQDVEGHQAVGVVHLPGWKSSQIHVKPGALIQLSSGATTVPLSSLVVDTLGRPVHVTTRDLLHATPTRQLQVRTGDGRQLTVTPLGGYRGPGAVSVEVTDGKTTQDRNGVTTTLSIPVQVGPDVPILRCPATPIDLVEGAPRQSPSILALCHVWIDTNQQAKDWQFSAVASPGAGGVSVGSDGRHLLLQAGGSAHPGAAGAAQITVRGTSSSGLVHFRVVKAPLAVVAPITRPGVHAGSKLTVDLAQPIRNGSPFGPAAQPQVLRVMHVTGPAGGATVNGTSVVLSPQAGTHGTSTYVAYVTDEAGHADRQVSVVIRLEVLGPPDPPTGLSVRAELDSAVRLSWSAPASNGAPITTYEVWANGRKHQDCASAGCLVTGLHNGTPYRMSVKAINAVNPSQASTPVTATPNAVPGAVPSITATPADQKVTVTWQRAPDTGTPITKYVVQGSPGLGTRTVTSGLSADYSNLSNGTAYTFTVTAYNAKGHGPGTTSAPATPYGKPAQVAKPAATGAALADPNNTGVTVDWTAPDGNGRPIGQFEVREYYSDASGAKGTLHATVGPKPVASFTQTGSGSYQQTFQEPNDGKYYVYTVIAYNTGNPGPPLASDESVQSDSVRATTNPDAVDASTLSARDHDPGSSAGFNGYFHVKFQLPNPHGASISEADVSYDGSSVAYRWNSPGNAGATVDQAVPLANGAQVRVWVRVCNEAAQCGQWTGPAVTDNSDGTVTPYGPPNAPNVGAYASGTTIHYSWSGGGNMGRPVAHYFVCIDNNGCSDQGPNPNGDDPVGYGCGQTHTIHAYVVDSMGQQSPNSGTASATTSTCTPPMSVSVSPGTAHNTSTCTSSACTYVDITVNNAQPNTVLNYSCSDSYYNPAQFWPSSGTISRDYAGNTVRSNGSGYASFQSQCVFGYWSNSAHHLYVTVNGTRSP